MSRPTKIQVSKLNDKYSITCVDEMTGSATGMDIPINGYEALKRHFETGAMEVSSDELSNCTIDSVSVSVCCKCKSDDIDIKFMPQRTNIAWSSHNTIKNIKNFTRNDSYYYNDMIDKECLIHTCKNCGFKEAVATER